MLFICTTNAGYPAEVGALFTTVPALGLVGLVGLGLPLLLRIGLVGLTLWLVSGIALNDYRSTIRRFNNPRVR